MLRQFLMGGGASLVNIIIHALVMTIVVRVTQTASMMKISHPSLFLIAVMIPTVSFLMVTHALEVIVWSFAYSMVDAAPADANLVYFAFVNYTTLGYGDVVPVERWRLLGPMTAMNGVLLFGWSTAFFLRCCGKHWHSAAINHKNYLKGGGTWTLCSRRSAITLCSGCWPLCRWYWLPRNSFPQAHTLLFVLSVLAIVPLAALLSHATESVAEKTGDAAGGLLNATLGNLTELVIAMAALRAGEYALVKGSIAGAIVTNTLFMLGASFLLGGLKHHLQEYNRATARLHAALLFLATIALVSPSAIAKADLLPGGALTQKLSVALAVLLIVGYGLGLLFSLKTHREIFCRRRARGNRRT